MKDEIQHTPGPWAIKYDNADYSIGGQWYDVGPAQIWFPGSASQEEKDQALTDARLIAAAPDLLHLAEYVEEECGGYAAHLAREAIAKAKGQA